MAQQPEANKQNAISFYQLMFNENMPRQAIERYVGSEYRQHNPGVADGPQAFIDYFERMAIEYPANPAPSFPDALVRRLAGGLLYAGAGRDHRHPHRG